MATIHLKGPGLNDYFAEQIVRDEGPEAAREKCCGPMLEAVERVNAKNGMDNRKHAKEIAQAAYDNGHVPNFLAALCTLIMCADPSPLTPEQDAEVRRGADTMAKRLGFSNWIEAYHGLNA